MNARLRRILRTLAVPVGALTVLAATHAAAAPMVDHLLGTWSDTFSLGDPIPGQSVSISQHVDFGGAESDGFLQLVPPDRPAIPGFVVQGDWSDGQSPDLSTVLAGQRGFRSVTRNLLYENFPGRLVLAPVVVGQEGALPFTRGPIAPLRTAQTAFEFYGYAGWSINAPEPSQSQTAFLFFQRDTRDGLLSMVFISNERLSTGGQNEASVYWDFWPLPEGSFIAESDDRSEFNLGNKTLPNGDVVPAALGRWHWFTCCSDGGALTLPTSEFLLWGEIIGGANLTIGGNGLDYWVDHYALRFYTELDDNAYTTLLLQQPESAAALPAVPIWMSGALSGEMDSVVFDLGARAGTIVWHDFSFAADVPTGGALRFFVRSGATAEALEASPWLGAITETGTPLGDLLTAGDRFVQYRAQMEIPDPVTAPDQADAVVRLAEVRIDFAEIFDAAQSPMGEALSGAISPDPKPFRWLGVDYGTELDVPGGEQVFVDVLDGRTFEPLLAGIGARDDIGSIDPAAHPSLRLRVRFATTNPDPTASPRLNDWSVRWVVDSDEDGIPNDDDNCAFLFNPDQADFDNDGTGDVCEDDFDSDGVLNADDNCPFVPNVDQADNELDGVGDPCDIDDDNDGVADVVDNCALTVNPDQGDLDGDYLGDVCDDDLDGDGLSNTDEATLGSDPRDRDSDDDGLLDGVEAAAADLDPDGDGLSNPVDPDSDNDGLLDGTEAGLDGTHLDPDTDTTTGNFIADADPTTTTDPLDDDTDDGGTLDGDEDLNHNGRLDRDPDNPETDPNNPNTERGRPNPNVNNGANNGATTNNGAATNNDGSTNDGNTTNNGNNGTDNNGNGASADPSSSGADDSSCACALSRINSPKPAFLLALLGFVAALRLRRRR